MRPNLTKRKNDKNFKIYALNTYQDNTLNSCAKFHLICRIIDFGSTFAQKLLSGEVLRQHNQKITCF